ncbi:hypothetical protein ACSSVY_001327 [Roseovarius sp. MBR-51]
MRQSRTMLLAETIANVTVGYPGCLGETLLPFCRGLASVNTAHSGALRDVNTNLERKTLQVGILPAPPPH